MPTTISYILKNISFDDSYQISNSTDPIILDAIQPNLNNFDIKSNTLFITPYITTKLFYNFIDEATKNTSVGIIIYFHDIYLYKLNLNDIINQFSSLNINIIAVVSSKKIYNIISEINLFIKNVQHYDLKRITTVYNHFSKLTIKQLGLKPKVDYFFEIIKNPIAIYDITDTYIFSTHNFINSFKVIPNTRQIVHMNNLYYIKRKVILTKENEEFECNQILFPIGYENIDIAFLAIYDIFKPIDPNEAEILEICATNTIIEVKHIFALKKIEENYIDTFLYNIIFHKYISEQEIIQKATTLKLYNGSPYVIVVFEVESEDNIEITTKNMLQNTYMDRMLMYIKRSLENTNINSLTGKINNYVISIVNISSQDNYKNNLEKISQNIINSYISIYKRTNITVGIGTPVTKLMQLSKSYEHATDAISFSQILMKKKNTVTDYTSIGILKLITKSDSINLIDTLIPEELKVLESYDNNTNSNLLDTLSCYLDNNCNAKKTSEQLFMHYKTIIYRLNKISEICKIDFSDSNKRLEFELGIRILRVIEYNKNRFNH